MPLTPKEEPLPPLPKFTRRKREPPNPDIPWISAIPMSNELDELKTRIKQIEFNRDEEVSALEEQVELAETEAIESTEKIETELKAIERDNPKIRRFNSLLKELLEEEVDEYGGGSNLQNKLIGGVNTLGKILPNVVLDSEKFDINSKVQKAFNIKNLESELGNKASVDPKLVDRYKILYTISNLSIHANLKFN